MRAESDDRHATRAQRIHGLGRQVRVRTVDDCQIRDSRAAGGDNLSEVGATTNNRKGLTVALYCLDEGSFVSLLGEDDDPVTVSLTDPDGITTDFKVTITEGAN